MRNLNVQCLFCYRTLLVSAGFAELSVHVSTLQTKSMHDNPYEYRLTARNRVYGKVKQLRDDKHPASQLEQVTERSGFAVNPALVLK